MIKILDKLIARSNMSAVCKVIDDKTNRAWAVKKTRKERDGMKRRLVAETELLKSLRHPNLPTIVDITDNGDTFLIIMEYAEGTALDKVVEERGAMSQDQAVACAKQLCGVLSYLHSKQPAIICGNIEPSNILLKPDGNVVLLDFCTVKEGKEGYAAPEQLDVNGQPDERTDLYCLGATLYYLMTGCDLNDRPDQIKHNRRSEYGLSRDMEKIIEKSTQPDPAHRYQSAAEMLEALNQCKEAGNRTRKSFQLFSSPDDIQSPQMAAMYAPSRASDDQVSAFYPDCRSEVPASRQSDSVTLSQVCFSAVVPKRFMKGEYGMIQISVYEEMYRSIVDKLIANADAEVKEVVGSVQDVERGAMIRIELSSPDIELTDCEETQKWEGRYLIFGFPVDIPNDYAKKQVRFTASVYFNGIIAAKLKFIASCTSAREQKLELIRQDVLTAFMSYAAQDRAEVATIIQGMKKIRPDLDVFFDVDNLRSGEYWETALKREIEQRDILFLCWSKFAKESEWVEREWKYALKNKGLDSIEPVSLVSPSECPPPEELKSKHFNDKALLYKKM